jgi:hypothetical protein
MCRRRLLRSRRFTTAAEQSQATVERVDSDTGEITPG